jgi:hypothetical protein
LRARRLLHSLHRPTQDDSNMRVNKRVLVNVERDDSMGMTLVAGSILVPKPAAGIITFTILGRSGIAEPTYKTEFRFPPV